MRINFTSILMRGCGIIFRCLFLVSEPMRTTINVDEKLLNDLMRLHKSGGKSEAINAAVRQFVRKKGIEHIRSMRGKLEFHPDVLKWRDTVE
ncbi:type II toxin-antitoxin system VapB family antitoxin, partial [bacterium]|nr:type II toxin-antitoxin system VapB family antitoxin [bacterium]